MLQVHRHFWAFQAVFRRFFIFSKSVDEELIIRRRILVGFYDHRLQTIGFDAMHENFLLQQVAKAHFCVQPLHSQEFAALLVVDAQSVERECRSKNIHTDGLDFHACSNLVGQHFRGSLQQALLHEIRVQQQRRSPNQQHHDQGDADGPFQYFLQRLQNRVNRPRCRW